MCIRDRLLELEDLLPKLGRELSKGQRQRVQIAAGFISKPSLFLFDEPFDGLDVMRTSHLMEILKKHMPSTAYIISSHRMDIIERMCDQIIVLCDGKSVVSGSLDVVCKELSSMNSDGVSESGEINQSFTLTDAMNHHLHQYNQKLSLIHI